MHIDLLHLLSRIPAYEAHGGRARARPRNTDNLMAATVTHFGMPETRDTSRSVSPIDFALSPSD